MRKLVQARLIWLKKGTATLVALMFSMMVAPAAFAITAPAAGSFAYDLYDFVVNDLLLGAPGFVAGVLIMAVAAINLSKNWIGAIAGMLGGVLLLNAHTLTASLGIVL